MILKSIVIVVACVVAEIYTAPADIPPEKLQPTVIPIVAQSDELEPNGTYKFSYETGNGIIREETAYEKVLPGEREASSSEGGEDDDGNSNEIHVQRGSYSYTAPDGTLISVSYIADENGFRPIGNHLPRSPVSFGLVPSIKPADKSGRALKVADSSKSASTPIKAKPVDKPTEPTNDKINPESVAIAATDEVKTEDNTKPEVAPVTEAEQVKTESITLASSEEESPSTPITEKIEAPSTTSPIAEEEKTETDVTTTEQAAEAIPLSTGAEQATTEQATTETVVSTTEGIEEKSGSIDVSTEAASTPASALSTTESEQLSTASVEQASTSVPESTTSSEVSEPPSSTSAPESTSTTEVVGQSTSTESVDQSPSEETGTSSANATESTTTEQSSSTTTA